MAAGHAAVPKFGSWDAENIGYTVFFEKVRDNKAPPAPASKPPGGYDFDPYEHYDNLSRKVPSRPPSSHGHGSGHAPAPAAAPRAPAGYDFDPYEHYENLSRKVPSRPPSSHGHGSGHAPAPPAAPRAPAGYDFDPYEHYENLSSRNVPSRSPSTHGHGPAPAAAPRAHGAGYDFDPYEHYENLSSRNVPSRPPSSHGHGPAPAPQHHRGGSNGYHRRTGSNGSSAASETSSRASKFSPPRPYQPRYSNNNNHHHHQAQHQQGAGAAYGNGHGQYHPLGAPSSGYRAYASPSPPRGPPPPLRRPKESAVPRFGVWDEQNAAMAAQGFTVQFEKVKRHREEAKAAAAPPVPPQRMSPDQYAPAPAQRYGKKGKANKSFLSKVYRCLFPVVRE